MNALCTVGSVRIWPPEGRPVADLERSRPATGGPGLEPRWTASSKDGIGTAYSTQSRIWFTTAAGIDRARADIRAGTVSGALAELARAVAQAGDPGRARDLLALALSADSPEIVWWMEALTECFPDVVRDVGHMFLTVLVPGGSAEQLAGDD